MYGGPIMNIIVKIIKTILYKCEFLRIMADDYLNWIYRNRFKEEQLKIKDLHNTHRGQRCFIVATGPSIKDVNLNILKNETTIGVNSLYREFKGCTYYAISDGHRWSSEGVKMLSSVKTLFLFYIAARYYLKSNKKGNKIPNIIKGKKSILKEGAFPKDISKGVYVGGASIVILCLQLAYYMGFKEVYLMGCDCNYKKGHFDGKKDSSTKWNDESEKKHWDTVFKAFSICKKEYARNNMKIYNINDNDRLKMFEKRKLEEVL